MIIPATKIERGERESERERDRQTDGETNRVEERQTYRDRKAEGEKERQRSVDFYNTCIRKEEKGIPWPYQRVPTIHTCTRPSILIPLSIAGAVNSLIP